MKRRIWNFRHWLAWRIAPGVHKHLSTYASHGECQRPLCVTSDRLARNAALAMDDAVRATTGQF